MKRVIAVLMLVVILVILSGCTNNNNGGEVKLGLTSAVIDINGDGIITETQYEHKRDIKREVYTGVIASIHMNTTSQQNDLEFFLMFEDGFILATTRIPTAYIFTILRIGSEVVIYTEANNFRIKQVEKVQAL